MFLNMFFSVVKKGRTTVHNLLLDKISRMPIIVVLSDAHKLLIVKWGLHSLLQTTKEHTTEKIAQRCHAHERESEERHRDVGLLNSSTHFQ